MLTVNIPNAVSNKVEKSNQNSEIFAQYKSIGAYRKIKKLIARDTNTPGNSCPPAIFFLMSLLLTPVLPTIMFFQ